MLRTNLLRFPTNFINFILVNPRSPNLWNNIFFKSDFRYIYYCFDEVLFINLFVNLWNNIFFKSDFRYIYIYYCFDEVLFVNLFVNLWNNKFFSSLTLNIYYLNIYLTLDIYIIVLMRFSLSICSWYGKLVDLCSRKSNEVANIDLENLYNIEYRMSRVYFIH